VRGEIGGCRDKHGVARREPPRAGAHLGIETGLAVAGILRRPSDIQSARETLSRPA
jgi:hypothetical protein